MIPSILTDDADFERDLSERLSKVRNQRHARINREARVWLALVPAWTDILAEACDFPSDEASLPDFIQKVNKLGLCQLATSLDTEGEDVQHFWMPESMRSGVLNELRAEEDGRQELLSTAAKIGERILEAKAKGVQPSPIVDCWSEVARHSGKDLNRGAEFLIQKVSELIEGDRQETGQAQTWLNAGRSLAQAVGGALESAVRVGEHRIELAYRKEQDERHLRHLLSRDEQNEAFRHLLENDDGIWALHYVGMGGVGKTMLLRQITARLAPELKVPTSRVDFDYLSPDYPVRRPGQLLLELATELRAYITNSRQESIYDYFQSEAIALHESLSAEPPPDDPLKNIRGDGFNRMLRTFCDFLELLPRPPVLILDTCEELAKVQLSGGRLPVLEATFDVLEQIHSQVPRVRFIFAGRRLLAKGGAGWRITGPEAAAGKAHLPEHKQYLALHEIKGFDDQEANDYLTNIKQLKLRSDLREAILQHSKATGITGNLIKIPPPPADNRSRYNPFDLSLYAEWVNSDPNLEADTINSGELDPYVECRIVQRIKKPAVQAILPAVVLLRRFNQEMLRPALAVMPEEFDEAYRELSDQEWIEHQRDESLQTSFLEINRNLYDRLYRYYAESSRLEALSNARRSLWPNLARLVRDLPLSELSTDHVDAALRLAPVSEAVALWDSLNRRISSEANWNWAQQVTGRILGEDGAVHSATSPLRAAVLATHAAASFHENPAQDLTQVWTEIGDSAHRYHDPQIGTWLRLRSRLKNLAAFSFDESNSADQRWKHFRNWISEMKDAFDDLTEATEGNEEAHRYQREQLAASFCAAIEAGLEQTPAGLSWDLKIEDLINLEFPNKLKAITNSTELVAYAYCLTGKALARKGRWREVCQLLDRAESIASSMDDETVSRQIWEDWSAPALIKHRIRLEVLNTVPPKIRGVPKQTLEAWRNEAADHLHLIDAERLVSLSLKLSPAQALVPEHELETLMRAERYEAGRVPLCASHRAVPPLTVSLSMGWLALGRSDKALGLLRERRETALRTRTDPETVRATEIAELKIIRRMRLHDTAAELVNRWARSQDPNDLLQIRELLVLTSSIDSDALMSLGDNPTPRLIHAWWRSQVTLGHGMAREPVERFKTLAYKIISSEERSESEDPHGYFAQLKVDWQEASLIAKKFGLAPLSNPDDFIFSGEDWWANHPTYTDEGLRLTLRGAALRGISPLEKRMIDQVGRRLVAEIALEEGELLALRLPSLALPLLDQAYALFCEVQDWIGAFQAMQLSTIADIHAGNSSVAKQRIERNLSPLYDHLATIPTLQLPTRPQLGELLEQRTPDNMQKLNHPSLGGWLQRWVRCLVWLAEPKSKGTRTTAIHHWLSATYGYHLPIELAFSQAEMNAASAGFMVTPLARRMWSKVWPLLGCTVTAMLMVYAGSMVAILVSEAGASPCLATPVFLLALYGIVKGTKWLRDRRGIPVLVSIVAGFIIYFVIAFLLSGVFLVADSGFLSYIAYSLVVGSGLLLLLGLRRLLRKPVDSWRAAQTEVALRIDPESTAATSILNTAGPVRVKFCLDQVPLTLSWLRPFPHRKRGEETIDRWEMPGLEPYLKTALDSPLRIANEFSQLNHRLRKRHLPVALHVAPALTFFPWEAVVTLALPKDQNPTLQFWRNGKPLPIAVGYQDAGDVNVMGNQTWGLMIENGWKPLTTAVTVDDYSVKLDPIRPRKVLHLIGQPVQTSAGLRLQMSGMLADGTAPSLASHSSSSSGGDNLNRNALLGIDTLPLSSTALVVVQAEPVPDLTPRLQTDRLQAARLREFAGVVFAAGARAVIVLPTMPPELAEAVLKILAQGLTISKSKVAHLLEIVDKMREAIQDQALYSATVERPETPASDDQLKKELKETRLELAFDVCLYARSDQW